MQMILSSVLENPVWRWRLQKVCFWTTSSPDENTPRGLYARTHTHATLCTRTRTKHGGDDWNSRFPEAAVVVVVDQALVFRLSPDRLTAGRVVVGLGNKKKKRRREPPLCIPRCNSAPRGRLFIGWEIETESDNTSLCGRQNEASVSHLSVFTRLEKGGVGGAGGKRGKKKKEGGRDARNRSIETSVRHSEVSRGSRQIRQADV